MSGFASSLVGKLCVILAGTGTRNAPNKKTLKARENPFCFAFPSKHECFSKEMAPRSTACVRFMISASSPAGWRGEQKAANTKPFLGSPWQQWATKEANQLPINTDRARSCLSCIRQLQAEISAVRSGTGRVSATARDSRKAARLTPRPALHS